MYKRQEEGGSAGWEEVELPERNEDIDPEVGMLVRGVMPPKKGASYVFSVSYPEKLYRYISSKKATLRYNSFHTPDRSDRSRPRLSRLSRS